MIKRLKSFLNPQQKWLTNKIPNEWCDKVELIPNILFACLVHYVEEEEGLRDLIDWTDEIEKGYIRKEVVDKIISVDSELRAVYDFIKYERPLLKKQLDMEHFSYTEANRIEEELNKKDLIAMQQIIKHYQILWT